MATLRDIKRRIVSVKNIQQITKAMKMVATAKLRRAQDKIINARPYARQISLMLSRLSNNEEYSNNIFMAQREVKNIGLAIVTADKGLCGAFNTNIIKEAARFINEQNNQNNVHLFCIGRKSYEFFSRRNYNIIGRNTGLFGTLKYEDAYQITNGLVSLYLNGKLDKIYIIYNEFKSIIQQKIVIEQFLPIPVQDVQEKDNLSETDYIFEPDSSYIVNYLLPKHLKAQIWRILLESNAAELGARMTAMDNATTNAKELIRTLQLKYNKERQAAITKEILEIVSGANALKES